MCHFGSRLHQWPGLDRGVTGRSRGRGDARGRRLGAHRQAADFELAKPERTKRDFSQEVEHELVERKVDVERTHTIVGQSGHKHHPTLFVPAAHALVEPIGAEAPWTRATAVYALFGDVMKVNGFSRYAVIDDRGDLVKDEIQNLLQQVGSLVYWSDRVPWMERVAR